MTETTHHETHGEATLHGSDRVAFALAGKATFTIVSSQTGARYTYKVKASKDGGCHFVGLLTGPDNESSYSYIGIVGRNGAFRTTAKSRFKHDATPVRAFSFWLTHPDDERIEFWHAGKCGRCGRKLTVPESVASGLGPVCATLGAA